MKLKAVRIMGLRLFSLAVGAAILTLVTLPARAENPNPFIFGNYVNSSQNVYLTVLPYPAPQEVSTEGDALNRHFYVGLTNGIINVGGTLSNGVVTGGTTFDPFFMYCVDFKDDISVPTTYRINVESLSPFSGDPGLGESIDTLELQATLGAQFGTGPSGDTHVDSPIQEDIWNLSSSGTFTPATDAMTADLMTAEGLVGGEDFSNAYLLDTTAEPGQQAFMPVDAGMTTHSNPLPEPGTLFLLGAGLLAVGLTRRSR